MLLKRQKLGAFQLTKDIGADGVEVDMGSLGDRETFDSQLADPEVRRQFLDKGRELGLEMCSLAMSGFYAQSFAERPTVPRMVQDCLDTMKAMKVKVAFLPLGTGADFRRTLEIPRDPGTFLAIAVRQRALAEEVDEYFTSAVEDLDARVPAPVVLYDGLKNLALVPYLLHVYRTNPTPGATAARFVFWYAFLRIFIDLFRDYPTHRLALGTGQTLNVTMAVLGAILLVRSRWRRLGRLAHSAVPAAALPHGYHRATAWQGVALIALLLFCMTIPSNWTQNVPERYGARHPGLRHSWLYPDIDTRP